MSVSIKAVGKNALIFLPKRTERTSLRLKPSPNKEGLTFVEMIDF